MAEGDWLLAEIATALGMDRESYYAVGPHGLITPGCDGSRLGRVLLGDMGVCVSCRQPWCPPKRVVSKRSKGVVRMAVGTGDAYHWNWK